MSELIADPGLTPAITPALDPETQIPHDIQYAIGQMKEGKLMARAGWNGKELRVGLQLRDSGSANTEPYVYMLIPGPEGETFRTPWTCSQADLLAHDWDVVE